MKTNAHISKLETTAKCNRCFHSWYLRTPNQPKVCPKCKSPYWNKERKYKVIHNQP